jgi:hypothetical protein
VQVFDVPTTAVGDGLADVGVLQSAR